MEHHSNPATMVHLHVWNIDRYSMVHVMIVEASYSRCAVHMVRLDQCSMTTMVRNPEVSRLYLNASLPNKNIRLHTLCTIS